MRICSLLGFRLLMGFLDNNKKQNKTELCPLISTKRLCQLIAQCGRLTAKIMKTPFLMATVNYLSF